MRKGHRHRHFLRAGITALLAAALITVTTGCSASDDLAAQAGNSQGYTSGDFRVEEIPAAERGEPVAFSGVTERGDQVSSDDYAGSVYVVNFWYAACGPCRVEAPMLEEVWQKHQPDGVGFLGINTYDQPATALSFAEDYGITYPSVIDVNDGAVKLAFAAVTPIQATPTTLVIDKQGRVAARIIGQLQSASILSTLVQDAVDKP